MTAQPQAGTPEPRSPAARFWDRIAERYARKPVPDEAVYREKLRLTRERLGPDMTVLELGCGTGSTAIAHASFVRRLEAVDLSGRMLEIARARAAEAGVDNLAFIQASLEDYEAPDESFDAVLALSLLHLVEDRRAALAKIHRLLTPGGLFVSSTACIADFWPWFHLVAPLGRRLGLFPPVAIFSSAALERDLAEAGFAVEHRWQPEKKTALFVVARKVG